MLLFVGLGNPGPKYARNRHNIGFMALDQIASDHGFGPWRRKFQGLVSEGTLGGEKLILLKPETFMNRSGQSVGEAIRFYKLAPEDVVVFHDELDLAPAKCKVKDGGGHAGHNGLRSLHGHIGDTYRRVRLGVGHPGHKDAVAGYVLRDFPKADEPWLDDILRGISDGAAHLAQGDKGRFMNAVALRAAPPRSSKSAGQSSRPSAGAQPRDASPSAPNKAAPQKPAAPKPTVQAVQSPPDTRTALQKLADRFR